jgi:hypothetical protein
MPASPDHAPAPSPNAAWQQRSQASVWHPCTQMQRQAAVPPIAVEELRLVGESRGGQDGLPALLARLQAATDLDLGRWLRPADPAP